MLARGIPQGDIGRDPRTLDHDHLMDDDLSSSAPPLRPALLARWLWQLGKDVMEEYRRDGLGDLAASITFWTILSIPAAVLALVSLLSSLEVLVGASVANDVENEVQQYVDDTFANSETLSGTVAELFNTSSAGIATVATMPAPTRRLCRSESRHSPKMRSSSMPAPDWMTPRRNSRHHPQERRSPW